MQELLTAASWQDAEKGAGVSPRTFGRWMRSDPNFRAAYDKLFDDRGEVVRKEIASMASKAAITLEEAFNASNVQSMDVECPHCHYEFEIKVDKPNWGARMKAIEIATKVGGQLKDVKKIEGEVVHMTLEHKIALARLQRDLPIPPHMLEELQRMGLLDSGVDNGLDIGDLNDDNVVDAEFEEISDDRRNIPERSTAPGSNSTEGDGAATGTEVSG